jgi:hypothetical protein
MTIAWLVSRARGPPARGSPQAACWTSVRSAFAATYEAPVLEGFYFMASVGVAFE